VDYGNSNCATCSLSSYGFDCHSIKNSKEPRLRNASCYPQAFASEEAIVRLIGSGDFPEEEIKQLQADLASGASKSPSAGR